MTDLSGEWQGLFSYPHSFPDTRFRAIIVDSGGSLAGTIDEIDMTETVGGSLEARIDGRHDGSSVVFTKFYALDSDDFDVVAYEGTLSVDECQIAGSWSVPGEWSGSFVMNRSAAKALEVNRREAVLVDQR